MKDNLVVQHNDLVTASYAMTRHEQNLLLSCISQIDSRKRLDEGQVFTLTVEQARDLFYNGNDQYNAYRDLKTASERLFERKYAYNWITVKSCLLGLYNRLSLTQTRGRSISALLLTSIHT